jgi:hypothetical protein
MTSSRGRPAFASDDWMLEQQMRAELEAEAWRRLRGELAMPEPAPPPTPPPSYALPQANPDDFDHHRAGSTILKAMVRFMLASSGAYVAFLAAMDSRLGEFEVWLAVGAAFMVTLALSMFGAAREFVHMLAETMRWLIIAGAGLGAVWLTFNWPG